ncbi:hypothetical protein ZIOFF_018874 [Zingiber officinale]|uniref:Uncharacterized protein n=1 Tax=Zingiber officinale TaxID=94328 RepID=A0A8J5HLC1_ZINOF|nr:hypothetical protein ZIOFF_018874 [Zingiber officinale]
MAATITKQQQVTTTPLFEDQIRSYRRNQRHFYNTQQAARRLGRQLIGGTSSRYTLEQQLEPEAQLQLSIQERASIVPAEVLYHSRWDDAHHRVYVHRSEEAILVTDNHQVDRKFIQEESPQYLHQDIPREHRPSQISPGSKHAAGYSPPTSPREPARPHDVDNFVDHIRYVSLQPELNQYDRPAQRSMPVTQ